MQRIRNLGLTIAFLLALSGVAIPSAFASSFLTHPTGPIEGKGTNEQVFSTNAGEFLCINAAVAGNAPLLRSLHILARVTYTECTTFSFPAHIAPFLYLFSADLKVSIQNDVVILLLAGIFGECQFLIGPAGNQNLNSVHYGNEGADLKVNILASDIKYTTTGGVCGESGSLSYTGLARIKSTVPGGVVRWDIT